MATDTSFASTQRHPPEGLLDESHLELKTGLAERLAFQRKTAEAQAILNDLAPDERNSAGGLSDLAHAEWRDGDLARARDLALEAKSRVGSTSAAPIDVLVGIGSFLAEIPGAEKEAIDSLKMAN